MIISLANPTSVSSQLCFDFCINYLWPIACTRDDCKLCLNGDEKDGGKPLNPAGYCTNFCTDVYNNSTMFCGTGPKYLTQNSIDCTECKHDPEAMNLEQDNKGK